MSIKQLSSFFIFIFCHWYKICGHVIEVGITCMDMDQSVMVHGCGLKTDPFLADSLLLNQNQRKCQEPRNEYFLSKSTVNPKKQKERLVQEFRIQQKKKKPVKYSTL